MSWQAYVDTSLVATGHVQKACIASIAGDSIWATSSDFAISADELKTIAKLIKEYGTDSTPTIDHAQAEGIYVAGVRYVVAGGVERGIYARKEKSGIYITKSKQAILIVWHGDNGVAGNASSVTVKLADYLITSGY
ncbi:profilin [Chaetomium tenue]|uniref:Profilin n=1 Tax=Chaetomium tenue TaxID=1854479 RepID=A0ACB7P8E9_9PEZI|nr:profilin [Chaetomium globosum]